MADGVRMSRTRGVLNGLALILLGAWGGLAPFAGPALGFGFTPDRAWQYTQGRLYLSAVPGAVAALAGIVVLGTRSRWFGGICAFLAALAGAWFIAGAGLIRLFPASLGVASVSTGSPISGTTTGAVLTEVGFFSGTGAAVVFCAALALGRFSVTAYRDYVSAEAMTDEVMADPGGLGAGAYIPGLYTPGQSSYPPQYPSANPFAKDPGTQPYPGAGPDSPTVTET